MNEMKKIIILAASMFLFTLQVYPVHADNETNDPVITVITEGAAHQSFTNVHDETISVPNESAGYRLKTTFSVDITRENNGDIASYIPTLSTQLVSNPTRFTASVGIASSSYSKNGASLTVTYRTYVTVLGHTYYSDWYSITI